MFGKRKKELIDEAYIIESEKDNLTSEQARNIGEASRAYTLAAQWFEKHVAEEEKKKVKNAKRLSMLFGSLAFMSVGAVLLLTPLKTVVPYVIRVDNNSGYTDIVRPGADQNIINSDDAYWAVTYIGNRESYDISNNDFRSKFVELTSYPDVFTEYKNFQLSKKGYLEKLADKQQIHVTIRNVSDPVKSDDGKSSTIQIRFNKTVTDNIGQPVSSIPTTTWLATISFDYSKPPKVKKDEWMSPRGFAVKSYQLSQEVGY
ncbi:virB8 family protein [Pantoea agglomerans]|uniref:virB8 family protein n=1 Tax=Enterobacter agglomerans TaxID=549 RepID=UPI0024132FE3|nr:type IV secretion system protein [Pantoea agglomerans]